MMISSATSRIELQGEYYGHSRVAIMREDLLQPSSMLDALSMAWRVCKGCWSSGCGDDARRCRTSKVDQNKRKHAPAKPRDQHYHVTGPFYKSSKHKLVQVDEKVKKDKMK